VDEETQHELQRCVANLQSINDLIMHRIKELERDNAALKQIIEGLLKVYAEN
jgi:hypothetical protein